MPRSQGKRKINFSAPRLTQIAFDEQEAGGRYRASMADEWRACVLRGDRPANQYSVQQALIPVLRTHLGDQADQVAFGSDAGHIFLYAPSIKLAKAAAEVAREALDAPAWIEGWDQFHELWRDADEMAADRILAKLLASRQRQAPETRESRQEHERAMAALFGFRRWQVRVELPTHRDVATLAGNLAARGWRVRRRIRSLVVWADCEDDARGLYRALSGGGGTDADLAIRAGRVSLRYLRVWEGGTA